MKIVSVYLVFDTYICCQHVIALCYLLIQLLDISEARDDASGRSLCQLTIELESGSVIASSMVTVIRMVT